ncbi:MAG: hypothetical protein VXY77_03845 [Pseudomonadota bacterium]|nr:hypothetical protein [Pseudomonadota bacterium]
MQKSKYITETTAAIDTHFMLNLRQVRGGLLAKYSHHPIHGNINSIEKIYEFESFPHVALTEFLPTDLQQYLSQWIASTKLAFSLLDGTHCQTFPEVKLRELKCSLEGFSESLSGHPNLLVYRYMAMASCNRMNGYLGDMRNDDKKQLARQAVALYKQVQKTESVSGFVLRLDSLPIIELYKRFVYGVWLFASLDDDIPQQEKLDIGKHIEELSKYITIAINKDCTTDWLFSEDFNKLYKPAWQKLWASNYQALSQSYQRNLEQCNQAAATLNDRIKHYRNTCYDISQLQQCHGESITAVCIPHEIKHKLENILNYLIQQQRSQELKDVHLMSIDDIYACAVKSKWEAYKQLSKPKLVRPSVSELDDYIRNLIQLEKGTDQSNQYLEEDHISQIELIGDQIDKLFYLYEDCSYLDRSQVKSLSLDGNGGCQGDNGLTLLATELYQKWLELAQYQASSQKLLIHIKRDYGKVKTSVRDGHQHDAHHQALDDKDKQLSNLNRALEVHKQIEARIQEIESSYPEDLRIAHWRKIHHGKHEEIMAHEVSVEGARIQSPEQGPYSSTVHHQTNEYQVNLAVGNLMVEHDGLLTELESVKTQLNLELGEKIPGVFVSHKKDYIGKCDCVQRLLINFSHLASRMMQQLDKSEASDQHLDWIKDEIHGVVEYTALLSQSLLYSYKSICESAHPRKDTAFHQYCFHCVQLFNLLATEFFQKAIRWIASSESKCAIAYQESIEDNTRITQTLIMRSPYSMVVENVKHVSDQSLSFQLETEKSHQFVTRNRHSGAKHYKLPEQKSSSSTETRHTQIDVDMAQSSSAETYHIKPIRPFGFLDTDDDEFSKINRSQFEGCKASYKSRMLSVEAYVRKNKDFINFPITNSGVTPFMAVCAGMSRDCVGYRLRLIFFQVMIAMPECEVNAVMCSTDEGRGNKGDSALTWLIYHNRYDCVRDMLATRNDIRLYPEGQDPEQSATSMVLEYEHNFDPQLADRIINMARVQDPYITGGCLLKYPQSRWSCDRDRAVSPKHTNIANSPSAHSADSANESRSSRSYSYHMWTCEDTGRLPAEKRISTNMPDSDKPPKKRVNWRW